MYFFVLAIPPTQIPAAKLAKRVDAAVCCTESWCIRQITTFLVSVPVGFLQMLNHFLNIFHVYWRSRGQAIIIFKRFATGTKVDVAGIMRHIGPISPRQFSQQMLYTALTDLYGMQILEDLNKLANGAFTFVRLLAEKFRLRRTTVSRWSVERGWLRYT